MSKRLSVRPVLAVLLASGCRSQGQGEERPHESIAVHAETPQRCPVCGGPVTPIEQTKDDLSQPSRNLHVWNRSSCGNPLFGPGSVICPRDWYAYSSVLRNWGLSLEDPDAFALKLEPRIRQFPLPEKSAIRSGVVYSQEIIGDRVVHSVGFWCDTDRRYLEKVDEYRQSANVGVTIERNRSPGRTYIVARVETQMIASGPAASAFVGGVK
jgi:hypothetical protein